MATAQELQDQYDALEQKRADLYNKMQSLSDQHASSKASLLGHDFAAMDKIRFNSALQPLRAQDRVLHQQQAALKSELLKADRDAKLAAGAPAAAAKAQLAAQKAANDAKKLASTNLEDASARAFGLGPKKGIDYVTQQGAFYDPQRGAIAVPDTKTAKTAAQKAAKGDAAAGKQVAAELSGFAKQAGVQGTVSPESFFGDNGFDMEQDKDGNYVYDANGTQVTIPEETAKRLQEQYNASLAPASEAEPLPTSGVKYIPVDTFNQANQALAQVKGVPVPNPVERFLQSNQAGREAQPAINAALSARDAGLRPPTVPSVDQTAGLTNIAGARAIPTDIPTGVRILDQAAYNQSGVDPIFAKISADREATRVAPTAVDQQVQQAGGIGLSKGQMLDTILEGKRSGLTPAQTADLVSARSAIQQQKENWAPTDSTMNVIANGIQGYQKYGLEPAWSAYPKAGQVSDAISYLNPFTAAATQLRKNVGDVIDPNSFGGQMVRRGVDYLANPGAPDILQSYIDAKAKREIGPDVTPQQYAEQLAAAPEPQLLVP